MAINLDNSIAPCLQGLCLRQSFAYLCLLSSSITTLTILSPCAAFMFVLFAFSCVLIAPVPTVVCKSNIRLLLSRLSLFCCAACSCATVGLLLLILPSLVLCFVGVLYILCLDLAFDNECYFIFYFGTHPLFHNMRQLLIVC